MQSTGDLFSKYQSWRRYAEPGFWVLFYSTWAIADPLFNIHAMKRHPDAKAFFQFWELMTWSCTSHLMLLALIPAVVAFDRRFPLHWRTLSRHLPLHAAACLVYWLVHIFGEIALNKTIYLLREQEYVVRNWSTLLTYSFLKDFRHYLFVIVVINFYRLFMLRWQGEASLLDKPGTGAPVEEIDKPERFLVRKLGKEFLLSASEIEWAQAQGNYVNLRVRGRDYPLRSTMSAIETRLNQKRFVRVHRSYIINLDHMRELQPVEYGDGRATMTDGTEVPVSRNYLDTLRETAAA